MTDMTSPDRQMSNRERWDRSSPGDEALAAVAESLADLYSILYDAHPSDAQAGLAGEVLTCTFHGGLSRRDESLIEVGRAAEVRDFREHFMSAVGDQFSELVRNLTGRKVQSFVGTFDPIGQTTILIFRLEPARGGSWEDRDALINWSAQVRRNARHLRAEHQRAREHHRALTDAMRTARQNLGRDDAQVSG